VERDEAVELSWIANAYLDAAIRICASIVEDDNEEHFYLNRVPLHLAYLALELYYKAGLSAFKKRFPPTHDLQKLRTLYAEAVPDIPLPIPSFIQSQIVRTEDLFLEDPGLSITDQFTRYRYYSDRKGNPFPELEPVDIPELYEELE
jgi:hypothetical protein